jgi:hypothetical protein
MSCLVKVMEHMVAKRLQHLAESPGMLNSDQSGFRYQRLTEDQVITLSQAISRDCRELGCIMDSTWDVFFTWVGS